MYVVDSIVYGVNVHVTFTGPIPSPRDPSTCRYGTGPVNTKSADSAQVSSAEKYHHTQWLCRCGSVGVALLIR